MPHDTEWCLHRDCIDSTEAFDSLQSLEEHMQEQHGESLCVLSDEEPWEMLDNEEEEEEEEVMVELQDDLPMQIVPGLFLGSIDAACNPSALEQNRITRSIRCCCDGDVSQSGVSLDRLATVDHNLVLQWTDTEDQDIHCGLVPALDFLLAAAAAGDSTLVHCIAGRSRSVVVVCCWLIVRYSYSLDDAIEAVRAIRPWVEPNKHFTEQLQQFDRAFQRAAGELDSAEGLLPLNGSLLGYLPRVDFHESFIEDLRDGTKMATTRVRGEHDTDRHSQLDALSVDKMCVAVVGGEHAIVMLRVTKIEERLVCEIDDELAQIENLSTGKELQDILSQFYPLVCPDDPVQVFHFLRPLDYDMIHC